jgi:hypothetical protein
MTDAETIILTETFILTTIHASHAETNILITTHASQCETNVLTIAYAETNIRRL